MPEPKEPASKPYSQPPVFVGEHVYWSFFNGSEKLLGLVTSKSDTTVNLLLTSDGQSGHRTIRGSRHITDPALKTMVESPGGVWKHTEYGKKIHGLID